MAVHRRCRLGHCSCHLQEPVPVREASRVEDESAAGGSESSSGAVPPARATHAEYGQSRAHERVRARSLLQLPERVHPDCNVLLGLHICGGHPRAASYPWCDVLVDILRPLHHGALPDATVDTLRAAKRVPAGRHIHHEHWCPYLLVVRGEGACGAGRRLSDGHAAARHGAARHGHVPPRIRHHRSHGEPWGDQPTKDRLVRYCLHSWDHMRHVASWAYQAVAD
mmetsp:Transcript_143335/g.399572  ORF Transcript_143335/g.399572 Transcript_143335/m.399572 type:complete len:224 (-) Transcript_143335:319-990(-)